MTKKIKFVIIFILVAYAIFLISITILRYHVIPTEVYMVESENFVDDGSFENFSNKDGGDCCNKLPGQALTYASKSLDSSNGDFSLNLTAVNHCACIPISITRFDSSLRYMFSFDYKGDNPRFCLYGHGVNSCVAQEKFKESEKWSDYVNILTFSNSTTKLFPTFYADSDGTKTFANYYDNVQFRKLTFLDPKITVYSDNNQYIIKTAADNNVNGELISKDDKTNEAYYLIKGKPLVTIKFPIYEIVIIVIIMLIITRLILKQDSKKHKEDWE